MVDLERFPTNETALEMMEMITGNGYYQRSYIAKWLFQVMGMEMENARVLFEELRQQIFPETATWGIAYHEQKYGMVVNENLTLEQRRQDVIRVRDTRAPMNPARVEYLVNLYTNRECLVTEIPRTYLFLVTILFPLDSSTEVLDGIFRLINRMKPSHLAYDVEAKMDDIIFQTENHFRCDTINYWMRIYNFEDTVLLNGWRSLDGTWHLGQVSSKGVKAYNLDFAFGALNTYDFTMHGQNWQIFTGRYQQECRLIIQEIKGFINNPKSTISSQMGIIAAAKTRNEMESSRLVVNTWLDQEGNQQQYLCEKQDIHGFIENPRSTISSYVAFTAVTSNRNEISTDLLDMAAWIFTEGGTQKYQAMKQEMKAFIRNPEGRTENKIAIQVQAQNQNQFRSRTLVKDSMYYLDGSTLFNGKYKLNAEIIEEEI